MSVEDVPEVVVDAVDDPDVPEVIADEVPVLGLFAVLVLSMVEEVVVEGFVVVLLDVLSVDGVLPVVLVLEDELVELLVVDVEVVVGDEESFVVLVVLGVEVMEELVVDVAGVVTTGVPTDWKDLASFTAKAIQLNLTS